MDDDHDSKEMDLDWANSFDDLDAEFWENHYGEPEKYSSFSNGDDEYLAGWSSGSRGSKPADSDNPLAHLVVGSHNQYTLGNRGRTP